MKQPSNNIIEIPDNDLGTIFRLKVERDTYGDFITNHPDAPPDLPPNRLMAQTWSQARTEARTMLYAIRACRRSSQGLNHDLPEDLEVLADKVIPEMVKGHIAFGKAEKEIPALLQRLLAEAEIRWHESVSEDMSQTIWGMLKPDLPKTVIELIRRAMKRRFDDSDMRYGVFIAKDDYAVRRRSTGEEIYDGSVAIRLSTDDFDLRTWSLTIMIGPKDEIMRLMNETQTELDKDVATGEARTYRRLGDEQ
jgi:hypothetical protein